MGDAAYRQMHKDKGLCISCPRPALPNQVRCLQCSENNRLNYLKYYRENPKELERLRRKQQTRRETNRCIACGAPLIYEDIIDNHVKCMNCREELHSPR